MKGLKGGLGLLRAFLRVVETFRAQRAKTRNAWSGWGTRSGFPPCVSVEKVQGFLECLKMFLGCLKIFLLGNKCKKVVL